MPRSVAVRTTGQRISPDKGDLSNIAHRADRINTHRALRPPPDGSRNTRGVPDTPQARLQSKFQEVKKHREKIIRSMFSDHKRMKLEVTTETHLRNPQISGKKKQHVPK